jgi:hypothetical protein
LINFFNFACESFNPCHGFLLVLVCGLFARCFIINIIMIIFMSSEYSKKYHKKSNYFTRY